MSWYGRQNISRKDECLVSSRYITGSGVLTEEMVQGGLWTLRMAAGKMRFDGQGRACFELRGSVFCLPNIQGDKSRFM